MSDPFAAPSCSIEVYPFEGGPYTLQGGQIRSVTVEKSLRGGSVGNVEVRLAPGGPNGPESVATWSQVITPMSHIVVGMSRGRRAAIVLDGVTTRTSEAEEWESSEQGAVAGRDPVILGADFAWFFRSFNWYALTFLGMGAGSAWGNALGLVSAGLPALIDQGTQGGLSPTESARRWYTKIMAAPGAILGKTYVPYKNNTRLPFGQVVSTFWEDYPGIVIPYADNFMATEQSWMDKFMGILPMPWYEFFVTTASATDYSFVPGSTGQRYASPGLTMVSQPLAPAAGPCLVARLNPTPALGAQASTATADNTLTELDMSRWNALPLNAPDAGFYASEITFDAEGARNFYQLNPTAYSAMFGVNNANNIPFPFSFTGAVDAASVQRYGFRPEIGTFRWMYDPLGTAAQNSNVNIPQTIAVLLARLVSWHHPAVFMAHASAVFPLMPDVRIGTRFRYYPFKGAPSWDFYVEAVKHRFVFGGTSTTSLLLSRGLPTAIYQDSASNGRLKAIHLGNAQRFGGEYVVGLPSGSAPPLTTFGSPESLTAMAGNLAEIFVTPQPTGY